MPYHGTRRASPPAKFHGPIRIFPAFFGAVGPIFYRTMINFSPLRAAVTLLVLAGLLGVMPLRIAYLQTIGRERTLHWIDRQQHQGDILPARRGTIFDRNG